MSSKHFNINEKWDYIYELAMINSLENVKIAKILKLSF